MADTFSAHAPGLTAPGDNMLLLALNDAADLANATRSLYIEGAGAVKITTVGGQTLTINVPANFILPVRVKRLWNAGTTAAAIYGIW